MCIKSLRTATLALFVFPGLATGLLRAEQAGAQTLDGIEGESPASLAASRLDVIVRAKPLNGVAPHEVDLRALVSGGQGPYAFVWDFGDGSDPAAGRRQEHTYKEPGRYKSIVRVTDSLGSTASENAVIEVAPEDLPFSAWCEIEPTEEFYVFQFRAGAEGGDGKYEYAWEFGDRHTSTRRNPKHAYPKVYATYVATLTVTSGTESVVCQWVLTLGGGGFGPHVECSSSGTGGAAPYTATFSAVAAGGMKPYTYRWDPGDGTGPMAGQHVTHTYTNPGKYLALVTVTDADGLSGICAIVIDVTDGQSVLYSTW